jgi:hypothetical protein
MGDDKPTGGRKSYSAYVESLIWLALATGGLIMSLNFDTPTPQFELSPAFWPRAALVGIIIAASVLGIARYLFKGETPAYESTAASAEAAEGKVVTNQHKLWAIFLLPVVYVFAMQHLGFYLVTPFFFVAFLILLGVQSWRTIVLVTVGFNAAIVLIFVKLLFTPMPAGGGIFYTLNGMFLGLIQ